MRAKLTFAGLAPGNEFSFSPNATHTFLKVSSKTYRKAGFFYQILNPVFYRVKSPNTTIYID